jgi:hypothetical protein
MPGGRAKGGKKFGGRTKGTPNKTTALLKDAILEAAASAGGREGLIGYLKAQAIDNPGPFMALLGKILPMQLTGEVKKSITMIRDEMTEQEAAEAYWETMKLICAT